MLTENPDFENYSIKVTRKGMEKEDITYIVEKV